MGKHNFIKCHTLDTDPKRQNRCHIRTAAEKELSCKQNNQKGKVKKLAAIKE